MRARAGPRRLVGPRGEARRRQQLLATSRGFRGERNPTMNRRLRGTCLAYPRCRGHS